MLCGCEHSMSICVCVCVSLPWITSPSECTDGWGWRRGLRMEEGLKDGGGAEAEQEYEREVEIQCVQLDR